jgi:CHAD domain-containing protein
MILQNSLSTTLPQLSQQLLSDAKQQAEHLGNTENSEVLHDFRVSVRHLRSFLKSFEAYIKNAKKYRQELSDIMKLTNTGRDHEVHVTWLKIRREKASEVEKIGLAYLLEHLNTHDHVDLKKVQKQFSEVAKKLDQVFSSDKNFKTKDDITFAVVLTSILNTYSQQLQTLLQSIESPEDEAIHEARIMGKRLRYTLELLDTKEADALIKHLKNFQDTTGDLHDLQVLEPKVETFLYAETLLWSQAFRGGAKTLSHNELSNLPELQRSYGLAEVVRSIAQEKTLLYKDLQGNWLGEASQDFFNNLLLLAEQLMSEETTKQSLPQPSQTPKARKTKGKKADKATV